VVPPRTRRRAPGPGAIAAALLLAAAVGVGGYFAGRGSGLSTEHLAGQPILSADEIPKAPAFSSDDLAALPKDAWITNGGSLSNERYSPLSDIDTSNVKELKGEWMTHLDGSGIDAKYSAEGQPLVYKGVVYVPTGQDDVFAVSVATGKILWKYEAKLDQSISVICCGWLSRGVALGDGKVFIGQLDGNLVALDQQSGEVVWKTPVARWQDGYSITHAPLYYDGRVITGVSGGEFGIRGRVTAFDADTGDEVWRFYTVPGPGEVGHDSWPSDNDSWKHGGAPVWQTPSVDPKLGLIYFSTGNASPDLDGSRREGDNLFNASIVAVDAKTGEHRWHYQMVHHDIWDYDAPSPTVLFDVEIGGKLRHGIAEAEKTGWLYLLDRETGKPLLPIPEQPVPQDANQKTAATQPIPSYPPFISHKPSQAQIKDITRRAEAAAKGKKPLPVKGGDDIYTPFWKDAIVVNAPGPQGGTNWQPTSYNPDTKMFYVCAQMSASGYTAQTEQPAKQTDVQQAEIGSVFTTNGFGDNAGVFVAIDATTGKIAWQHRWPESCYSGSTTTGGNLVFVGRNNGELQAYDATTGDQLWSFQTGAGANSTATVFDQGGREYIAFLAGGNALAAAPHGDNLWLFSLDGTMGPAAAPGGGQGVGHAGETEQAPSTEAGNAEAGKAVFSANCSGCHGLSGHGGNGGPDLSAIPAAQDMTKVVAQVENGGGGMPPFKGSLSKKQIHDVSAYVTQDVAK
jgi:alcohol dehydrogenase (cytochrome c)